MPVGSYPVTMTEKAALMPDNECVLDLCWERDCDSSKANKFGKQHVWSQLNFHSKQLKLEGGVGMHNGWCE